MTTEKTQKENVMNNLRFLSRCLEYLVLPRGVSGEGGEVGGASIPHCLFIGYFPQRVASLSFLCVVMRPPSISIGGRKLRASALIFLCFD